MNETLLTQLAHGTWEERIQAADELAEHRGDAVVAALVKALKDRDSEVRSCAVDALGTIGGPEAIAAIVEALDDEDSDVQMRAAENLGNLGAEEAVEPLIRLLKQTSDALLRVFIVEGMGDIGDHRFTTYLLESLTDDDELVRSYAASALGDIGTEEIIPLLKVELAAEESSRAQLGFHCGLVNLGCQEHFQAIVELLVDEDYRVRCASANTLGWIASDENRRYVIQVLSQAFEWEPTIAARSSIKSSLVELRADVQDAVTESYDEDDMVTIRNELLHLSTAELLKGTLEAASNGDEDVVEEHGMALLTNGSEEIFEQASQWCRSQSPVERSLGADILGQFGGNGEDSPYRSRSLPILYDLLRDSDPNVLRSTLIALGHLRVRGNREPMLALVEHPDEEVRFGVVFSLLGNETESAVTALIQLSRDHDADVRDWATFGLGTLLDVNTSEVQAALLARTEDAHDDTRQEAIVGLAERADRTVLPALIRELESDCVGTLVVEAARDLGSPELSSALQALTSWWDVDNVLLQEAIASCHP
jgi:HEAT repeat protein